MKKPGFGPGEPGFDRFSGDFTSSLVAVLAGKEAEGLEGAGQARMLAENGDVDGALAVASRLGVFFTYRWYRTADRKPVYIGKQKAVDAGTGALNWEYLFSAGAMLHDLALSEWDPVALGLQKEMLCAYGSDLEAQEGEVDAIHAAIDAPGSTFLEDTYNKNLYPHRAGGEGTVERCARVYMGLLTDVCTATGWTQQHAAAHIAVRQVVTRADGSLVEVGRLLRNVRGSLQTATEPVRAAFKALLGQVIAPAPLPPPPHYYILVQDP